MHYFPQYLKDHLGRILLLLTCAVIFALVFSLYRLPLEAVLYASAVCGLALLIYGIWDYYRWQKRHRLLENLRQEVLNTLENLPDPSSTLEADWDALVRTLFRANAAQAAEQSRKYQGMIDYYTLWAHQIKTPIAAMGLILQTCSLPEARSLQHELFQIQQYVDMVLCYLRLDSETTDYLFRRYDLDGIIRQALRKFGPSFIRKRLQLHYEPVHASVLTDEKWLLFVLEQVLSNAIKYTPSGSVTIRLEAPATLVIEDTGLGIAPEDLPRIFERGYTGQLGRTDKRSTGIGLYLCRRILTQLGHSITAQSAPGKGTAIRIFLDRQEWKME